MALLLGNATTPRPELPATDLLGYGPLGGELSAGRVRLQAGMARAYSY